jgi:hypothetical protein
VKIDTACDTWEVVQAFVRRRIAELHAENEDDYSPEETATIRGMIRFAREIENLPVSEQPAPVVKSGQYI